MSTAAAVTVVTAVVGEPAADADASEHSYLHCETDRFQVYSASTAPEFELEFASVLYDDAAFVAALVLSGYVGAVYLGGFRLEIAPRCEAQLHGPDFYGQSNS